MVWPASTVTPQFKFYWVHPTASFSFTNLDYLRYSIIVTKLMTNTETYGVSFFTSTLHTIRPGGDEENQ